MQPRRALRIDENQNAIVRENACQWCGEQFETYGRRPRKYCSNYCQQQAHSKRMRGRGNGNYKGTEDYLYTCPVCGKEFISYRKGAKYCSRSCLAKRPENLERMRQLSKKASAAAVSSRPKGRGVRNECAVCGAVFYNTNKRKYCDTHKGYRNGRPTKKGLRAKCVVCGKMFTRKHVINMRKTCSSKCRGELLGRLQEGERSHRWQGGKTAEAMKIRNSRQYKRWRMAVFERDNYTCQICGRRGGRLNADHIKPFSQHPELRLVTGNGRTLCEDCHRQTPTWGSRLVYGQHKTAVSQQGVAGAKV